jgi:hypothetical protein
MCLKGIGVGGDYPLSAVITAEFASTKNRGGIIGMIWCRCFHMQLIQNSRCLRNAGAWPIGGLANGSDCGRSIQKRP